MKCVLLGKKSKNFFLFSLFFSPVFFLAKGFYLSYYPSLPSKHEPIVFYSNQTRHNLRSVFCHALEKGKQTIHLVTYGFNDPKIFTILKKQTEKGLDVKVFFDKRASFPLQLPNKKAYSIAHKGLLHQKILVVDGKRVFLGSANMTTGSLLFHDNLIVGIYAKPLAHFLMEKTPFHRDIFQTNLLKKKLEIHLLPDVRNESLQALLDKIRAAKTSIFVACFNLTHPQIVQELILAKNRGLKVEIFLDRKARFGACSKACEAFKKARIPIYLSQKAPLFHHKCALIDKNCLILGSANWTKAAFSKNHDCFLILHDLGSKERAYFSRLHHILKRECKIE